MSSVSRLCGVTGIRTTWPAAPAPGGPRSLAGDDLVDQVLATGAERGGKPSPPDLHGQLCELPTEVLPPLLRLKKLSKKPVIQDDARGRKGAKREAAPQAGATRQLVTSRSANTPSVGRSLTGLRTGPRSPQEPRS